MDRMTPNKTVTWDRGNPGMGTGEGQHLRATIQKGSRTPFWIGTRNDGTPGGGRNCSVEETRTLRDMMNEALDEQIVTTDQLAVVDAKRAQAVAELEAFKQQVALTAARWPDGCESGKREFLDELGLDWPTMTIKVEFEVEVTSGDAVSEIESNIQNGYSWEDGVDHNGVRGLYVREVA